jgi:hypothetical protein
VLPLRGALRLYKGVVHVAVWCRVALSCVYQELQRVGAARQFRCGRLEA